MFRREFSILSTRAVLLMDYTFVIRVQKNVLRCYSLKSYDVLTYMETSHTSAN